MKKLILLVMLSLVVTTSFSQKKKSVKASATTISLAIVDNLVAEVKSGNFQLTIDGKDAIVVKPVDSKFTPNVNSLTLVLFLFKSKNGRKYKALMNPQAIKVQLAPCQKPLTRKMIKVFRT